MTRVKTITVLNAVALILYALCLFVASFCLVRLLNAPADAEGSALLLFLVIIINACDVVSVCATALVAVIIAAKLPKETTSTSKWAMAMKVCSFVMLTLPVVTLVTQLIIVG